jgi:hypothetical protein
MDVVVLNEESNNMPEANNKFWAGKTTTPPMLHVLNTQEKLIVS